MTDKLDVDRLARECGFLWSGFRGPELCDLKLCDRKALTAYARAVMEACAKACWPDPLQDSISPYMQGRIDCRDVIEEMMP